MTLKKADPRGSCKLAYDQHNEVLIGQRNDNKVVNISTTQNKAGIGKVLPRIILCPLGLRAYQRNMFSVDKGDEMRSHGAGFSQRVHFKK